MSIISEISRSKVGKNLLYYPKKTFSWMMEAKLIEFFRHKHYMDDRTYIEKTYKKRFGVFPDLDNPKNFNEKSNWRKLNDRRDIYTSMVDKYKIKQIIKERIGEQYTFSLLGVWDKAKDIDFEQLPQQFVLKANHAGGVIVCRDKSSFDAQKAVRELNNIQKRDYYHISREWPYKNVEKKIIAEEYKGENLIDYKNYCFNGELKYTLVWKNVSREDGRKPNAYFCGMYDGNWEKTDMKLDYPSIEDDIENKPNNYAEMKTIVERMAKGIPFVRVDCYLLDNKVYIGEMTFFPWGGFQKFKDEKWNNYLGMLEKLPGIDY